MRLIATFGTDVPVLVAAFVASGLLSLVGTPLVARVAGHLGAVDQPNHRRVNAAPVPRGGGVAVALSFLIVATVLVLADEHAELVPDPNRPETSTFLAVMLGGFLAMLLGLLDDAFQLRARWQLLTQLVVVAVPVAAGVYPAVLNNPVGPEPIQLFTAAGVGFTVLWILGMINSINFIDGLDGLSSGISLIAAATLGTISFTTAIGVTGQPMVGVLCFALAGSLLGFLRWNFHPARIFIGTTGVMFVGYMLAILSILGAAKVAVALLVLGVPIIDTFWIIVRRVATGRSPFTPDRGHIHHRLLDLGLSHAQTVLAIYGICLALAVGSIVLSSNQQVYAFLGLAVAFGVGLFLLARGDEGALEAESYEGGGDPEPDEGGGGAGR
jgi:UDP-GlcNAc:undecaprenyl-phosphate/decaprenyl-phosphate GlcNAc-1-phosphate transferase